MQFDSKQMRYYSRLTLMAAYRQLLARSVYHSFNRFQILIFQSEQAAMKTSELESNIKELLREIKAVKKGKRTRFIEELTMQLRPLSESNDDSNALSDKLSSIGLSKAQFDL
jgi:cell division protein FtsB